MWIYNHSAMRLAHFSDLHILSLQGSNAADFLNKRALGGVNLLLNRGRHYKPEVASALIEDLNARGADEVVCTGDVTNLALRAEFARARTLFDRIELGPEHVTCIPGNHDNYVPEAAGRFEDTFAPYCSSDDAARWPLLRVRGEVAIIGLSSSQARGWLWSYGELGPAQLARLERVLEAQRGRFRVILLHHPCAGPRAVRRGRGLSDHDAFAQVVGRAGAELILHGHEHERVEETLAGIPVRCVPSASYEGPRAERMATWRTYLVEGGRLAGVEDRVYDPATRAFRPLQK